MLNVHQTRTQCMYFPAACFALMIIQGANFIQINQNPQCTYYIVVQSLGWHFSARCLSYVRLFLRSRDWYALLYVLIYHSAAVSF